MSEETTQKKRILIGAGVAGPQAAGAAAPPGSVGHQAGPADLAGLAGLVGLIAQNSAQTTPPAEAPAAPDDPQVSEKPADHNRFPAPDPAPHQNHGDRRILPPHHRQIL